MQSNTALSVIKPIAGYVYQVALVPFLLLFLSFTTVSGCIGLVTKPCTRTK